MGESLVGLNGTFKMLSSLRMGNSVDTSMYVCILYVQYLEDEVVDGEVLRLEEIPHRGEHVQGHGWYSQQRLLPHPLHQAEGQTSCIRQ